MKSILSGGLGLILLAPVFAQAPASTPSPDKPAEGVRRIELPVETVGYRPGLGADFANSLCLNCHSAEYCQSQPPLPEKYWDGTVKKMKEKFGAIIPDEAIAPLVKYLTTAYGNPVAGK